MKRKPVLASINNCTGCMGCIDICPVGAINQYINDEGHYAVRIDHDRCIGCLRCEKFCNAIKEGYGTYTLEESEVFAGWADDYIVRKNATSGGIFGAVATNIILNGGVVIGASFDGRLCRHIMISSVSDIHKLQGSKYTQSNICGIFKTIENVIPKKIVLFSGTGCQCAAVKKYFEGSSFSNNLYTMDLICGGVPSLYLIDKYFEHYSGLKEIVAFRNKEKYELTIDCEMGITIDKDALPVTGFANEYTNRYSCYHCRYSYPHRISDITIGDLWGYDSFEIEKRKGISLIVCHSLKGKKLLSESDITLHPVCWEKVLHGNRRLIYGYRHVSFRRKHIAKAFEKRSYEFILRYYGMVFPKTDVVGMWLKMIRKIWYLNEKRNANRLIKKALKGNSDE